jgi:hypothetical protein
VRYSEVCGSKNRPEKLGYTASATQVSCGSPKGLYVNRRTMLPVRSVTARTEPFLRHPHCTTTIEGLKALLIAESPIAFRRRLIFTEAEPLRRARMPTGPQQG